MGISIKAGLALVFLFLAVFILISSLSLQTAAQGGPSACTDTNNFTFAGWVAASNFSNLSNANVSIFKMGDKGNQTWENSTNTTETGSFSLFVPNGTCSAMHIIKVAYKNSTNVTLFVGPVMPPLPKFAIEEGLANGTFYLQNASTLNLSAINVSGDLINFSYMVMDTAFGMPIDESVSYLTDNAEVAVPIDRNYTVVMMIPPDTVGGDESAATPPISISVTNLSDNYSYSRLTLVRINLSYTQYNISGYINVTGNSSAVNVEKILNKLSVSGMVFPNSQIQGLTVTIKNSADVPGYFASYNITVMGSGTGVEQILEFYANNSNEYFAHFQNFTVTGNTEYNITLRRLSGAHYFNPSINTTYHNITIVDGDSGSTIQDAHIELESDVPDARTFKYMVESLTNSKFAMPLIQSSNVTVKIFSNQFAPREKKLNLSLNSSTITLYGFDMKKMQDGEDVNFSADSDIRIQFMKYAVECNIQQPNITDCKIGNDFDGGMNPLKAMMAGKSNLRMTVPTTGVVLYFINVDMLASGPPDAVMSDNVSRETEDNTTNVMTQIWRFGSMAPDMYDHVYIGIPYTEDKINENIMPNVSMRRLFDDEGNEVWNTTNDPGGESVPTEWSDYNTSWFNSTTGGIECLDNAGAECFINTTTNYIWIKIPHFSDDELDVDAPTDNDAPTTNASINASMVNDSDSDGNIELSWVNDTTESNETYNVYKSNTTKVNTTNYNDTSVVTLIKSGIAEGTHFFEDNQTTNGSTYWYGIVTVDLAGNFNGTSLTTSFNATANDTVKPKAPTQVNATSSAGVTTIRWTKVDQDVNGSADEFGLSYLIWYKNSSSIDLNKSFTNETADNIETIAATSVCSGTACSRTHTFPGTSSYYYIVTTKDDANNRNSTMIQATNGNFANVTLTLASSESGGDTGGSGGGGGGSTVADPGTSKSQLWSSIGAGASTTMTISKTLLPVTKVTFTVQSGVSNAELKVTALDTKPATAPELSSKTVYKYLKFEPVALTDANLQSADITFDVTKSWLTDNRIAESDVALYRYHNTDWDALTTTKVSSTATAVTYKASAAGFSYFAIGSKSEASSRAITSAFEIIDIIREFYAGTSSYTAFDIIDIIRDFYETQ